MSSRTIVILTPTFPLLLNDDASAGRATTCLHFDDDFDAHTASTAQSEPSYADCQPLPPKFRRAKRRRSISRKSLGRVERIMLLILGHLPKQALVCSEEASCAEIKRHRIPSPSKPSRTDVTCDRRLVKPSEVAVTELPEPSSLHGKRVSFHSVEVRLYEQTLGDNPSVTYGPPISLDWEYRSLDPVPVDSFEAQRDGRRRSQHRLALNHYTRSNLLSWKYGFSSDELERAAANARRVQRQRAVTRWLLPVQPVEEAARSVARKVRQKWHTPRSIPQQC